MISQDELVTYQTHLKSFRGKQEKMDLIKANLSDMETNLIKRLEDGEEVELGKRHPSISETERRTVQWKALVQKLKGKAFVTKELQKAVASITKRLLVVDVE